MPTENTKQQQQTAAIRLAYFKTVYADSPQRAYTGNGCQCIGRRMHEFDVSIIYVVVVVVVVGLLFFYFFP